MKFVCQGWEEVSYLWWRARYHAWGIWMEGSRGHLEHLRRWKRVTELWDERIAAGMPLCDQEPVE